LATPFGRSARHGREKVDASSVWEHLFQLRSLAIEADDEASLLAEGEPLQDVGDARALGEVKRQDPAPIRRKSCELGMQVHFDPHSPTV